MDPRQQLLDNLATWTKECDELPPDDDHDYNRLVLLGRAHGAFIAFLSGGRLADDAVFAAMNALSSVCLKGTDSD